MKSNNLIPPSPSGYHYADAPPDKPQPPKPQHVNKTSSAGRSNMPSSPGKKQKPVVINLTEISRACDRFLVAHIPGYRVRNFHGQDVTAEVLSDG